MIRLLKRPQSTKSTEKAKRLLSLPKYASESTAMSLIEAMKDPAVAPHAKELLLGAHYATPSTANKLFYLLGDKIYGKHAKELLAASTYATPLTTNRLLDRLKNPQQASAAAEVLSSPVYANPQAAIVLISFFREPETGNSAFKVLENWLKEKAKDKEFIGTVTNSLVFSSFDMKKPEKAKRAAELLKQAAKNREAEAVLRGILVKRQVTVNLKGETKQIRIPPDTADRIERLLSA